MKKLFGWILMLMVCLIMNARLASAGLSDYHITFAPKLNAEVVGAYDIRNKEFLAGYSVDLIWLKRKDEDKPILYLSPNHLFNYDRAGKGAIGASIGLGTGGLGRHIQKGAELILPEQSKRLGWLRKLGDYVSIEVGGGHKFYDVVEGQSLWYYSVGGKVRIPLEKLRFLFKK